MKLSSVNSLENLNLFCHVSGIITVFLGIIVILMDLAYKDFAHIQVGIFVLATGYSFVKISSKLARILRDEKSYN